MRLASTARCSCPDPNPSFTAGPRARPDFVLRAASFAVPLQGGRPPQLYEVNPALGLAQAPAETALT